MSASGKNLGAIYKAKQHHDANCPWGGEGKRVLMSPFDVERMGWEEGDVIAGLVLVADDRITTGRLQVECDAEPESDKELIEAASKEDLVHA